MRSPRKIQCAECGCERDGQRAVFPGPGKMALKCYEHAGWWNWTPAVMAIIGGGDRASERAIERLGPGAHDLVEKSHNLGGDCRVFWCRHCESAVLIMDDEQQSA